jgi:type IV pilus assembly protein PilV
VPPVNRSKGFTIIEILIALVILSVSLLALAGMMGTTTQRSAYGGHLTEAVTFAQDKLEEFRAIPWVSVPVGDATDQKAGATQIAFTRNWGVVMNGNLKTITIRVDWTDRSPHSITLVSVLSQ